MVDSIRLTIKDFNIRKINWSLWKDDKRKNRSCNYRGVKLDLYLESNTILLTCNTHNVLDKKDICTSDLKEFQRRINAIIEDTVQSCNYSIELNRLDFYSDVFIQDDYIFNLYIKLLLQHQSNYLYMKEKEKYSSSKHISTGRFGK